MLIEFDTSSFTVYGFKKYLNKDCDQHKYSQFSTIADARQACKQDKNCSAITDVNCGDGQMFHLCPNTKDILNYSELSCIHEKVILGKEKEGYFYYLYKMFMFNHSFFYSNCINKNNITLSLRSMSRNRMRN